MPVTFDAEDQRAGREADLDKHVALSKRGQQFVRRILMHDVCAVPDPSRPGNLDGFANVEARVFRID